ncbi:hypothetical protein AT705_11730 [Pseudoalteromonas rubra]|uniref:Uncharacterized protein n=1 Tax=Pseudoalteromonas rubra TaxID=43658 RepID=A0A0U3I8W3_9GAMM|nr:hypothetical protein AT705_11730 [Pseudoalteromonas rubra]
MISPGERTYSGETTLAYNLSQAIDYIAYHSIGLTLSQIELRYLWWHRIAVISYVIHCFLSLKATQS